MSVETITKYHLVADIVLDESPESPREWDNLGRIVARNSDYLPNELNFNFDALDSWDREDIEKALELAYRPAAILPIYLYSHSGVTIKTSPFGCRWDSGMAGWILVPRENALKEYGVKRLTAKLKAQMLKILEGEIQTLDSYMQGDIYGYEIRAEGDYPDGDTLDSCYGYYGLDYTRTEVEEQMRYYAETL